MSLATIYIASSQRSGSTLIDLLLSNHRDISGLGEVHRLSLNPATRECTCGEPVAQCPYWRPRIAEFADRNDVSPAQWTDRLPTTCVRSAQRENQWVGRLPDWLAMVGSSTLFMTASKVSGGCDCQLQAARNSWSLFEVIGELDDSRVVVDSTKNAMRMKLLYMTRPSDTYVIHLVRDGRAIAASAKRRLGTEVEVCAHRWYLANRNIELALATCRSSHVLRVKYEDLCDHPRRTLNRIVTTVGLQPDEGMTSMEKADSHQIPGNPMLFRRSETEIKKDERWKNELSSEELDDFEEAAGYYNRHLGY